ncbi:MAG: hypothetical protein AAF597_02255 [Bacteroidota bacterium]
MFKYLIKMMTSSIKVSSITEEAPNTFTFKFDVPKGMNWSPGANGHFVVTDNQGVYQMNKAYVRHLSIMNNPAEGYIGFTTRVSDNPSLFKASLKNYTVGDEMRVFKVKNHIPLVRDNTNVVLISMGVGIATFRPMIMDYANNQDGIKSLTNINIDRHDQHVYKDELTGITAGNYRNDLVSNRENLYDAITETFGDKRSSYYVVGSDEFLGEICAFLSENDIEPSQIHLDKPDIRRANFIKG